MGILGSIGGAIKKAAVGVGHAAGKVLSNPIVQTASAFIPGVGPLITAGEGALGGLLKPGGNLGQALSGGIQGGLAGAAGGSIRKLGSGILSGGLKGGLSSLGGLSGVLHPTGTFAPSSGDPYGNIIDYDAGGNPIYAGDSGSGGFDWLGAARKLGSGLLGGGNGGGLNLGGLATAGLAGYQAINAANASKRAGQLSDKALSIADQRYSDAAPLRSAGMARLLNAPKPDLSSVFTDQTNPFAVRPAPDTGSLEATLRSVPTTGMIGGVLPQPLHGQPAQGSGFGLIRKLNAGGV